MRALPEKVPEPYGGARLRELVKSAQRLGPIRTAVIHPVDAISLRGAAEAAREGLIVPVLIGPEAKMRAAAQQAGPILMPTHTSRPSIAKRRQRTQLRWHIAAK